MSKSEIVGAFIGSLALSCIFFYKIFLGFIPIPADLLTGAYYPWLDYKWGYAVGVPVKNPALSDVISTSYPWKFIVYSAFNQGVLPLWNPYIFAGFPLLANWQSGVFYPFNLLMVVFGPKLGWSVMTLMQPLFSLFFMYLFLRSAALSRLSAFLGGVVFAYAGFMMIFLEYNYLQAGIWLPLVLFLIENYIRNFQIKWLIGIPILIFIIVSAGNFQITLYSILICGSYFLFRLFDKKSIKNHFPQRIAILIGIVLLGLGMSAIQMLPTIELLKYSIRQLDSNIIQYNYGLLPLHNLITFIIPDFFGNPATGNFRGFIYHETMGYFGIVPLILALAVLFSKKSSLDKYALGLFIASLLLVMDTDLGRFIYIIKVPLLSTSYASRGLFVLTLAASILAASAFDKLSKNNPLHLGRAILAIFITLVLTTSILLWFRQLNLITAANAEISLRNSILPTIFVIAALTLYLIKKRSKQLFLVGLVLLTLVDLLRFGFKYNPFVKQELVYPPTPILEYLKANIRFDRIEREKTEVLPPNTWVPYGLMSPEGYDPLAYLPYARFFNLYNGNPPESGVSRYLELGNYNSPFLDLLGVKYLIAAKRQGDKITPEGEVKLATSSARFKKVFEDKSTAIVENMTAMSRVSLFDSFRVESDSQKALANLYSGYNFKNEVILDKAPNIKLGKNNPADLAQITRYSLNQVDIDTISTQGSKILLLTDTYYPGWEVWVSGKQQRLYQADGIFRAVVAPEGKSTIKFIFNPTSFKTGIFISAASLLIWFSLVMFTMKTEHK